MIRNCIFGRRKKKKGDEIPNNKSKKVSKTVMKRNSNKRLSPKIKVLLKKKFSNMMIATFTKLLELLAFGERSHQLAAIRNIT